MTKKMIRKPTHPGELIRKDYLEPLNLKITTLAERLGVSRKTLSAIINERAGVTPDMGLRLARAFSTSPELWLNLQRAHDLWVAEHQNTDWKKVSPISLNYSVVV